MTDRRITKHEQSRIRQEIMAMRDGLLPLMPNTRETIAVSPEVAMEDQASLLHDQSVALASHEIDRHKLRMINGALDRMERGEYGICQECDDPIAIARLRAVPWAPNCVECQERIEREASDSELELSYA